MSSIVLHAPALRRHWWTFRVPRPHRQRGIFVGVLHAADLPPGA